MHKRIMYKSNNGLKFRFGNNAPYYLEKIDATSLAGVFSVDTPLGKVGQVTTGKTLGGRTIICDFAVVFASEDMRFFQKKILSELIECFNPTVGGKLQIITDFGNYEIECYPQEVPKFDNSKIPWIYRFTVDFVCDYPYFKSTKSHTKEMPANTPIVINSKSFIDNQEIIVNIPSFSDNFSLTNNTTGKEIRLIKFGGGSVILDVSNLELKTGGGSDVSKFIDTTCDMEDFSLKYGKNELVANLDSSIEYNDILLGVI